MVSVEVPAGLAQAGPNVLSIVRTGGGGTWIQHDFIRLSSDPLPDTPLVITGIQSDGATSTTITWNSKPDATYTVFASTDGLDWFDIADSWPSGGDETSYTDTEYTEIFPTLLMRVQEEE